MKRLTILSASLLLLAACSGTGQQSKTHGPIRLGDAQTIITETDSQYLRDLVPDIEPIAQDTATHPAPAPGNDTAATTPTDKPTAPPAPAPPAGNGLTIAFKEVTLFIPGVTARNFSKTDLGKSNSAGYQLATGKLAGNSLQVSGGTVTKITQRYQTVIALQNEDGDLLPLTSLGTYSSPWEALSGKGTYSLAGLNPASLQHPNAGAGAVRNAVTGAARAQRLSRDDTKDWQALARSVRTIGQAPTTVILKNVSWQLQGKDAGGKPFRKEVRIDIP